jgi:hypothetical protein
MGMGQIFYKKINNFKFSYCGNKNGLSSQFKKCDRLMGRGLSGRVLAFLGSVPTTENNNSRMEQME